MFKPALALTLALALAGCGAALAPAAVRTAGPLAARALDPARFFAHADLAPGAFAVTADAVPFLEAVAATAPAEREALVAAIRREPGLAADIRRFAALGWAERLPVLKRVLALEAATLGFEAPPLLIKEGKQRAAYFDFDPARPDTGRVHLYPEALAEEADPCAALLLLVHETRHSGQFQLAFGARPATGHRAVLAAGYRAGFLAQPQLKQPSYCDFCSLNHEYEAFQTGNYVVGALTGWTVDTSEMGCYSSQFDAGGRPRLDLLALARRHGAAGLLGAFNEAERAQFRAFGGR